MQSMAFRMKKDKCITENSVGVRDDVTPHGGAMCVWLMIELEGWVVRVIILPQKHLLAGARIGTAATALQSSNFTVLMQFILMHAKAKNLMEQ